MDSAVRSEMRNLIKKTKSLIISAVNSDGVPMIKGVTKLGNDDLNALYFVTSPKSEFAACYKQNPIASVFLFDDDKSVPYPSKDEKYYSLSLTGKMEAVADPHAKQRFLTDYLAPFYPKGVNDENYYLMRFVVQSGKYYRGVTDNSLSFSFNLEGL